MRSVTSLLKNKYFLSSLLFGLWMIFFDHNDIFQQNARSRELRELEESKAFYQGQIKETSDELKKIEANNRALEKIAREKYMMKKDNEDLYIITPTER
ncbi:FtsB family cell division protein [Pollutibacter soli]|uniref:FtsB family cell division protein n=1 Tax=Pollutibacter soli TaxID=3034157 RepID=UPI0030132E79